MKLKLKIICLIITITVISSGCLNADYNQSTAKPQSTTPAFTETPVPTPILTPEPFVEIPETTSEPSRGFYESIPSEIREKMAGISMPEEAGVAYDDLSYLTVYYYSFDYTRTEGHIIVAKELSDEVLDIFAELYDINYPIESISLIDDYNDKLTDELDNLDRASMGNNNTSAFYYRTVEDSENLSQHAFGRAIDLNPKINPWIRGKEFSPANAEKYLDRSGKDLSDIENAAMIRKDDDVYKIFTSRGWQWGGDWKTEKDYQHFFKKK